ncbi:hypothetical protein [Kurthia huakuii]|uniref:hypothetical protein n=1 Tax=Kurthia huakuii TaxID=1421019 RepID=UPI0004B7529C|nr:hypothetical protein [Kurthia huakuii]MBM7700877.1 hypothetical protein [Kurthia huakuii]
MTTVKIYELPPIHRLLTIIACVLFMLELVVMFLMPISWITQLLIAVEAVPFIITTFLYVTKGSVTAIPSTALTSIVYMALDSYYQRFQTERTLLRLLVVQQEAPLTNDKIAPLLRHYPEIIYTYRLMQLLGKDSLARKKHVKEFYKDAFQSCDAQDLKILNDFGISAKMIINLLTNGHTSVVVYRTLYKKEIAHWYNALEETLAR